MHSGVKMVYLSYICFILFIHHSYSYVLLTASVDDVNAIAAQVARSPVVSQIRDIFQQASKTFLQHYEQGNKRAKSHGRQKTATTHNYNQDDETRPLPDVRFPHGLAQVPVLRSWNDDQQYQVPKEAAKGDLKQEINRRYESPPAQLTSQEGMSSQEEREQRKQAANALLDLGRNASVYLRSLQNILETL